MEYSELISFIFTSIIIIISPGPDLIYAISVALESSKASALKASLGFAFGNIIHLSLFILGFGVILKSSPNLLFTVKAMGAAYLFYIGIMAFRSHTNDFDKNIEEKNVSNYFIKAFIMNILNPKVIIFFMAFFPQFIDLDTDDTFKNLIILGGIFIFLVFIIFSTLSLFISKVARRVLFNNRLMSYFNRACGILFIGISIRILFI